MQTLEMQKFTGKGGSIINVAHEPVTDAASRTRRFILAVIDGADFDSSHIPSEAAAGVHTITERDYDLRDAEGSAVFLHAFTFHNVILLSSSGGVLTYSGWLTSARCYDDGSTPPKENGSYQWLPPHSDHFARFLPCKVRIEVQPKR